MDWRSARKGYKAFLLLERGLSSNSINAYKRDIEKLETYTILHCKGISPDKLIFDQLAKFIHWLNDMGLEASSQARIISAIRSFYKYLVLERIVEEDPSLLLEGPKLRRNIPEVLSFEEIQTILEGIDLSTPQGTRNRAMIETLYASGLRVSELVNLKLSNLHLKDGFLQIVGKGNKERLVPIGGEAIKFIETYITHFRDKLKVIDKNSENVLFLNRRGKQLTRVMVYLIVKEAAKLVGVTKKVSPHTFRHSFATHLVEGGANLKAVQDMLGHESIITTEIYTHLDTEHLRDTILKYHPLNMNKDYSM